MPNLFLHLFPDVTREVLDVVRDCIQGLHRPPRAAIPEDDEDLAEWWLSNLNEVMGEDCGTLVALLESASFGKGKVRLTEVDAERVLRACSAIRLRLQQTTLAGLPEDFLDGSKDQWNGLTVETQAAFRAYLVLASIQEKIVASMDPDYGLED